MNDKPPLTPRQKLVVIVMDVLLLVELTFCIYLSNTDPDSMVPVFLCSYAPMMLVTLLSARFVIKRMGRERDNAASSGKA